MGLLIASNVFVCYAGYLYYKIQWFELNNPSYPDLETFWQILDLANFLYFISVMTCHWLFAMQMLMTTLVLKKRIEDPNCRAVDTN
jgi:hypothetical protein